MAKSWQSKIHTKGLLTHCLSKSFVLLLKLYQLMISPYLGARCRFFPSCSHFAIEALQTHGFLKACFFISKRLLKCQPLSKGGFDPVPSDKPRD